MMDSTEMALDTPDISSFGDALSGREEPVSHEGDNDDDDDDLYYIPERRPSLDLGPAPMDTSQWYRGISLFVNTHI